MTPEYKAIKNILDANKHIADVSQARQLLDQLLPYSAHWDDCRNVIAGYIYAQLIWTIATSYEVLGDYENAVHIADDGLLKIEADYAANVNFRITA